MLDRFDCNEFLRKEDFIEHVLGRGREYGINVGFREFVLAFDLNSTDDINAIRGILYHYEEYLMRVDCTDEIPPSSLFDALYRYACAEKYRSINELYEDLKEKSKWEFYKAINEYAYDYVEGIEYGTRLDERKEYNNEE